MTDETLRSQMRGIESDLRAAQERIAELEEDAKRLRVLLFHSHGCTGKYGDDGELQCNRHPLIDFRRDSVADIDAKTTAHGLQRFQEEGGWSAVEDKQRIAELEGENARLREALESAHRDFHELRQTSDLADCIGFAMARIDAALSTPGSDTEPACDSCGHPQRYHIKGGCVKQTGSRESSYWPGEREAVLCSCKWEVKP